MTINRVCMILWVVLFVVGMWLAMHKPLWCDELYTQKITIEGSSWKEILTGKFVEGINSPLYYTLQKAIMSVIHLSLPGDLSEDFQLPVFKRKYNSLVYPQGQIFLRLLPDTLMTTAIVFLVRFFWVRDGLMVGLMALLSALTSGMVWGYWVEARPYPLWFLLTLIQALFLIEILSEPRSSGRVKVHLIIGNCLLALTTSLGFIQVIIAQGILFLFGQRQFKFHVLAGILPVCIGLFFLSHGLKRPLFLSAKPEDIIKLNFSFEQLSLIFFYLMAFSCRQVWVGKDPGLDQRPWKGLAHLPNLFIGFCLSIMMLGFVGWRWPGGHEGLAVYVRHFLFLSALGVVMVPAMFSDLWSRSRSSPWWQGVFLSFFIVLLCSQLIEFFSYGWLNGYYF